MSGTSNSSGMTQPNSIVALRKNVYRRASAMLGLVGAGLALIALPFVYFLLVPFVFISAILMLVGGVLVWTRNPIEVGAFLVLVGGFFGGLLGHSWLLYMLLAAVFGSWVYRLPLLPLGMLIPLASFVLAIMSRQPSKTKLPQPQQA